MNLSKKQTWDIFCHVIDNYGDIGVCWRLARQLANEYPFEVRLWVDELAALQQLEPATAITGQQYLAKVNVCLWSPQFIATEAADVVIEAFACELPPSYLNAMKQRPSPSCWINLEYLSAEDWVENCHGLISIHPSLGLRKTFFFPGFTAKTGGLLREKTLAQIRSDFLSSGGRSKLMQDFHLDLPEGALLVSLFGYENPAIGSLLDAWSDSVVPIVCIVPTSKILPDINAHLGISLAAGENFTRGSLQLRIIPFLNQQEYDHLLWSCDLNVVRGEDSFIRAQWAAKPLVWHIYAQADGVHLDKLAAFTKHYLAPLDPPLQEAITELWFNWNKGLDCRDSWTRCIAAYPEWRQHSANWCQALGSHGDLAANLVQLSEKTL
jgi:uncharacterized repeat protein (TIGR03837 family)